MLDAAREAVEFLEARSREELGGNRMLLLAVVKDIEIVGEAASRVSDELKVGASHIPWIDIVGMRNRLIHAYFDINLDIVWDTVTANIPPLIAQLEKLLATDVDD
jgi:uncharacterized protein with HEPN domain